MLGRTPFLTKRNLVLFTFFLLAVGIFSAILFDQLDDRAYAQLRFVQTVLDGEGLSADPAVPGVQAPLPSPLFVTSLVGLARLGFSLEVSAVFLRGLGWAIAAVFVAAFANRLGQPLLTLVPPILIAANPSYLIEMILGELEHRSDLVHWLLMSFPLKAILTCILLCLGGWLLDSLMRRTKLGPDSGGVNWRSLIFLSTVSVLFFLGLQGALHSKSFQRSSGRQVADQAVADWLIAHTPPSAIVVSEPRQNFLANRAHLHTLSADTLVGIPYFIEGLMHSPADFVVSEQSLTWDYVTRTGWFAENYRPAKSIEIIDDSGTPFTIWERLDTPLGQTSSIPISISTEEGVDLIGYRLSDHQIQPGSAVYVQLDWQVTRPPTSTVETIVRLESPWD